MTGISTFGRSLNQINLINDQTSLFSKLSTQLATGQKTQEFSGLGNDVLTSKRARADIESIKTYTNNIDNADRRIKLMLNAINEFKAQAGNFLNALTNTPRQSVHQEGEIIEYDDPLTTAIEETRVGMTSAEIDIDLQGIKDLANNIYGFMTDTLNTKEGDRYLLGGADTNTRPIGDSAVLDAAVSTLIGNWKDETLAPAVNLTNTELISALQSRTVTEDANAITDTIIGYSAALSADNVGDIFVRVNETTEVKYTALADDKAFRDIMVAISYFKNDDLYPIADVYAEPYTAGDPTLADGAPGSTLDEMKNNFYEVYSAMTSMVAEAMDDLERIEFNLESARARIDTIKQNQVQEQSSLLGTISDVENVDINEVGVKIQTLQVQLDASYRITALMGELSLTRFI